MRQKLRTAVMTLTGGAALTTAGCDLIGPGTERFLVRVDSISAPAIVAPDETLRVVFFGHVGPDGCSRITRVDKQRTPARLEIAFHGERDDGAYCTQVPVELRHEEAVAPPLEDPFVIRVTQPGSTSLERVVHTQ